ncbi:MAG: hypothetical protein ACK5MN_00530 [Lachnospiraceae bacterium]
MDMIVRNLPEDVVLGMAETAKKLGMSREAYVRRCLIRIQTPEAKKAEDRMLQLRQTVQEVLMQSSESLRDFKSEVRELRRVIERG